MIPQQAEIVAMYFHYAYEEAARQAGWETQERSRLPWDDVPEANKRTMIDTVQRVAALGVIRIGPALDDTAPFGATAASSATAIAPLGRPEGDERKGRP